MSNAYLELKDRQQKEINDLPIKWAFGHKQFTQMMTEWGLTPGDDNDKIAAIGYGGFIRKSDRDLVAGTFQRHKKELEEAIAADDTGEGFVLDMFRYELRNHEFIVTNDCTDTLNSLGMDYEEVRKQSNIWNALRKACKEIVRGWEGSE